MIKWVNKVEKGISDPKMNGTKRIGFYLFLQKACKLHLLPKSSEIKTTSFPETNVLEEVGMERRIND